MEWVCPYNLACMRRHSMSILTMALAPALALSVGCEEASEQLSARAPLPKELVAHLEPPTPGEGGTIVAAELRHDAVTLQWTKAHDDKTKPELLTYTIFYTDVAELKSLLHTEIIGVKSATLTDSDTFRVKGLAADKTYYFNVVVEDEARNRAAYAGLSVRTNKSPDDITIAAIFGKPTFEMPSSTALTVTDVTTTGLTLSWEKATELPGKPALEYQVYRSSAEDLATLDDTLGLGVALSDAVSDAGSLSVTGLAHATAYAFNVVVADGAGNKAAYTMTLATTDDDVSPSLPTSPTPSASVLSDSSVRVTWSKATDNVTASNELTYQVYHSETRLAAAVASAASMTEAGAPAADIDTLDVSGLTANVKQYFLIVARDAAGNAVAYPIVSATPTSLWALEGGGSEAGAASRGDDQASIGWGAADTAETIEQELSSRGVTRP